MNKLIKTKLYILQGIFQQISNCLTKKYIHWIIVEKAFININTNKTY